MSGLPRTAARAPGVTSSTDSVHGLRGVLAEAVSGFPMLAREERPRSVVVLLGLSTVLFGALDVLLVVLAIEQLSMGQSGVGFLNAALGAGGIVGSVIAVLLVGRPRLAAPFGAGLLLWGAALAAVGSSPLPLVAVVVLAVAGIGRTVMDVAGRTLLQRVAPDAVLSRIFGVLEGIEMASLAIGAIVAPVLIALAGIQGAFLVAGLSLVAVTALSWRTLLRIDAAGAVHPRELGGAHGRPILRAAPRARAGAAGSGTASGRRAAPAKRSSPRARRGIGSTSSSAASWPSSSTARRVRTLGPGESFGEIALLRGVPRTATIRAEAAVELLALDRHHFLEAVTGQPASAAAADIVIHAHLDRSTPDRETDARA